MLRDPVERTISHYYWLKARNPEFRLSLAEALESGEIHDNLQTRVLAADVSPAGELPGSALERAARALERFDVVGLTEQFDASLALMHRAFGWARLPHARVNVTKDRRPRRKIDPETIALIERHNALDAKLYRRAEKLFARQIRRQGAGFGIEADALAAASASPVDGDVAPLRKPVALKDAEDPAALRSALVGAEAELLRREAARIDAMTAATALADTAEKVPRLEEAIEQAHASTRRKAEHNTALRAELRDLRAAHAGQIAQLKKNHGTQLTALRGELRELRTTHAEQISQLKQTHEDQLARLENKNTDRLLADTERQLAERSGQGRLPAAAPGE